MDGRVRTLILVAILAVAGVYAGVRLYPERAEESLSSTNTGMDGLGRVRVEILNAGGVPGRAQEARDVLRDRGFDVVYIGNADAFDADTTVVLDRVGWEEASSAVHRVLGVGRVGNEPDTLNLVDITILLGRDWKPPTADSVERDTEETGN